MEPGKAHGYWLFHTFHTFHTCSIYTRAGARACVCAHTYVTLFLSMEGMEVWKSTVVIGFQPSIPVPYLNLGMEDHEKG